MVLSGFLPKQDLNWPTNLYKFERGIEVSKLIRCSKLFEYRQLVGRERITFLLVPGLASH